MAKRSQLRRAELPVDIAAIGKRIYLARKQSVMMDSDLAALYGVTTGNLNLAVRRNRARFPEDFMFQLETTEADSLILQNARSKGRGGRRHKPFVFTEQGVAMLSSVLKSDRAIHVNIAIMRAFVRVREILFAHKDLAARIDALERNYGKHDKDIKLVFKVIQDLMRVQNVPQRRKIGFIKGKPTTISTKSRT